MHYALNAKQVARQRLRSGPNELLSNARAHAGLRGIHVGGGCHETVRGWLAGLRTLEAWTDNSRWDNNLDIPRRR